MGKLIPSSLNDAILSPSKLDSIMQAKPMLYDFSVPLTHFLKSEDIELSYRLLKIIESAMDRRKYFVPKDLEGKIKPFIVTFKIIDSSLTENEEMTDLLSISGIVLIHALFLEKVIYISIENKHTHQISHYMKLNIHKTR